MKRLKSQGGRVQETPVTIEEDSPPKLTNPNKEQSGNNQDHDFKFGTFKVQEYIARIDEFYQSPPKEVDIPVSPLAMAEPLHFLIGVNHIEREAYEKLQWKNKKLKKMIKEYKVLNIIIQEENEKFKTQGVKNHKEIKRLQKEK